MRKIYALVLVCLVSALSGQADAQQKDGGKPALVVTDVVSIKASVESVDQQKRTVTLKGPQGNRVAVKISKDVKNFDQVKAGDQLVVKYYDSVALFVQKSSEPPVAGEATLVEVAAPGQKPAGMAVDVKELTANVEAIDYKNRTVTLKGPLGNSLTLKADKNVKRFDNVKKGDEVVVRHTEALAIAVEQAK